MMDWQPIESKMFTAAAHDEHNQVLYLRFTSGDVYRYFNFPAAQYQKFLHAESRGRYFLSHIRDLFSYERLARLHVA
jgi:KTSC domain